MQVAIGGAVELVRRHEVAQPVAAVVGEEQLARARVPVEAKRIAHAAREHLEFVAVRTHAQDGALEAAHLADVARRADRDVEQLVRAERRIAPAVVPKVRQHARGHHDLALAGRIETADLVLLDHEQGAILVERDAVWHLQAARDLHHLVGNAIALGVEHRDHPIAARADVDPGAALRDRQRARPRHGGEHLDRKPRGRAQAIERQLPMAIGWHQGDEKTPSEQASEHHRHAPLAARSTARVYNAGRRLVTPARGAAQGR